ncbi:CvpA family protein [Aquimarina sp. 2201CG5-10]|uniref:CvpA family protein n=1 Tax=Aquimarina callyspongiae TaxID=3098150 RepID=UPI002AB3D65E|nr:CvpA family protein [Aquimarina sp. 2201CG5-10]MDY8138774.1 CvpA family protein [Aquimarina sp. 2201CG5-10]
MNYIDIILGILLLWGLVRGFMKGLFVSLASLVALVAGIYIAVHFSHLVGDYLQQYVDWQESVIKLTAFAITFILVVILISMAGKLLTKIADLASLGIVNKLLGAAFGVLKFAFIASVVLMFVDAVNQKVTFIKQETLDSSILYKPVRTLAPTVLPSILKDTDENKQQEEV